MNRVAKSGKELSFLSYSVHEAGKLVKVSKKKHVWKFLVSGEFCELVASESVISHSFRAQLNRELLFEAKVSDKQLTAGIALVAPACHMIIRKADDAGFDLIVEDELFVAPALKPEVSAKAGGNATKSDSRRETVAESKTQREAAADGQEYFGRPAKELFCASQQPKSFFSLGEGGLGLSSVKEVFSETFKGLFGAKKATEHKRPASVARPVSVQPPKSASTDYASFFFSKFRDIPEVVVPPSRPEPKVETWWEMEAKPQSASAGSQAKASAKNPAKVQAIPDLVDFSREENPKAAKKEQIAPLLLHEASFQQMKAAAAPFKFEPSLQVSKQPLTPNVKEQKMNTVCRGEASPHKNKERLQNGGFRARSVTCQNFDPNTVKVVEQLPEKNPWTEAQPRGTAHQAKGKVSACQADLRYYPDVLF